VPLRHPKKMIVFGLLHFFVVHGHRPGPRLRPHDAQCETFSFSTCLDRPTRVIIHPAATVDAIANVC